MGLILPSLSFVKLTSFVVFLGCQMKAILEEEFQEVERPSNF